MPITHEPWLVMLSLIVAIQGAYVGLSLAVQVGDATGARRRLLLVGAATSLAVAIWSMHFVGMLAARLPFPVDYLVPPTLLSFLVCVLVVGAAVLLTSMGPLTIARLTVSACLMGGGIFTMHYIGMAALHASAHMVHAPLYVAASMAVAIGASGLALWLAAGRSSGLPLALSATAFGLAVSGMHYTAMAGLTLFPHNAQLGAPALSSDLLAIVVAVVAFLVSGVFLLFLVPDRSRAAALPAGLVPTDFVSVPAIVPEIAAADVPSANISSNILISQFFHRLPIFHPSFHPTKYRPKANEFYLSKQPLFPSGNRAVIVSGTLSRPDGPLRRQRSGRIIYKDLQKHLGTIERYRS